MANGAPLTLYGRVILRTTVVAVTGLHIGAPNSPMAIGGVDSPVVREPLSGRPYLPGSSLRGKMRAQTEKVLGLPQNFPARAAVKLHAPETREEYDASPIGRLYGVPGSVRFSVDAPTRLIVRDAFLTDESVAALARARTDLPYTELKAETSVDRVTAEAVARHVERIPAGAQLGPLELVYSVYESRDVANFMWAPRGLALVEDDYLGGHGSRGSGKVRFTAITVTLRSRAVYSGEASEPEPRHYPDVAALLADQESVEAWIRTTLAVPA
ncbi:MAG: type III-A CRISPR-associated RAMP protein Csm3 [Dehalococcoidia bacterium]|nr:type III-A CRISPR-associated RAMP protein Csm3 [Dehalococcoidia bacterium]